MKGLEVGGATPVVAREAIEPVDANISFTPTFTKHLPADLRALER